MNRQDQLNMHSQFEREILQSQMEVREQTLEHIGQELHDNIGQLLTVVRINLSIIEDSDSDHPDQQVIKDSNEAVGKAISDLRTLSKSLDGNFTRDFGIEKSLANELLRIRKIGRISTELHIEGSIRSFGFQTEIVLFRICQEILNNILKHADATYIDIVLIYEAAAFRLKIVDNGKGFDYQNILKNSNEQLGSGLGNINRRVDLLGGQCQFTSQIGIGTTVEIVLI